MTDFEIASLEIAKQANYIQIIGIIFTLLSVVGFYIDYRNRKNKEKTEKSIALAEKFAHDIIDNISIITVTFKTWGLDKIIKRNKFTRFIDFDIEELKELYSEEELAQFTKKLTESDTDGSLSFLINETLNELEYMCMYITTGVADKNCIYNSLHQQFFKAISYLYINISLINVDNKDKYYTNIINVYNIWKEKYIKACKQEKYFKDKLKPKNKKIN